MLVSTDCASAIANSPHTDTSARSATVPISLRVRMDIGFSVICGEAAVTIWSAWFPASKYSKSDQHARSSISSGISLTRGAVLAARRRGDDLSDAGGRRRHAADRVRALDCGMEAGHRYAAANVGARMASRVNQVSGDPAIPRAQPRHDPRPVQDDLLVGMVTPDVGARDRRGVPAAVFGILVARLDSAKPTLAAVGNLHRGRFA